MSFNRVFNIKGDYMEGNKKTILIVAIVIIAIIALVCVAMGLFGGLTNQQNNITTVGGFQFNIPDGYKLDNLSSESEYEYTWELGGSLSGLVAVTNDSSKVPAGVVAHNETSKVYNNGNKTIEIFIEHPFNGSKISSDKLNLNKTINGVQGQFKETSDHVEFVYVKDGHAIHIAAPDESLVSNIIVNK